MPLKVFALLSGGILLLCATVVAALPLCADYLTRYIPFLYEQALFDGGQTIVPEPHELDPQLKSLADRIVQAMDLPDDVKITARHAEVDEVNAYATFSGHVVSTAG